MLSKISFQPHLWRFNSLLTRESQESEMWRNLLTYASTGKAKIKDSNATYDVTAGTSLCELLLHLFYERRARSLSPGFLSYRQRMFYVICLHADTRSFSFLRYRNRTTRKLLHALIFETRFFRSRQQDVPFPSCFQPDSTQTINV